MKKILLILSLFSTLVAQCQIKGFYDGNTYYEEEVIREKPIKKTNHISFAFGLSNYLGDLGGNTGVGRKFLYDNNFKKRTYFYGFSFTHYRYEVVGLRLQYTAGNIAGSDHDVEYKNTNDNAYYRYKRNLDFQSKISEGSIIAEIVPLKFIHYTNSFHHFPLQPYFMLGIGRFKFNPQGSYYDPLLEDYRWVDLQPLRTEGQGMSQYPDRKPYKLSQTNIPFGFGVKYQLGAKTFLAFEFLGRKLYTDYLDDVSTRYINPAYFELYMDAENADIARTMQNKSNIITPDNPYGVGEIRGNSKNNDFYYSFNLTFSVRLNKMKKYTQVFKRKVYKYDDNEICD